MNRVLIYAVCVLLFADSGCSRRPRRNSGELAEVIEIKVAEGIDSSSAPPVFADSDWPQWRGPQTDGTAIDKDVPTKWDETTNVAWKADVPGRGHASPILVGSLVLLATAIEDQEKQLVIAYDRATGEQRWQKIVHEGGFPDHSEIHAKGTNANSTLASDGDQVFAVFFNSGKIFATAIDLKGEQIWQKEIGAFGSKFGYAPSPVIFKSTVIVTADNWGGGYIAALDRKTGEIVWRKKRPSVSTYSSPLLASIEGRDQLVISGCDRLVSFDPANGNEIWSCEAISEATCGTPVTDGSSVFASGGYPEKQTIAVKADGSGKIVWSNKTKIYEPSLIATKSFVFGVSDEGIAWCWSNDNGKVLWKQRLGGSFSASPILCNGKIYVPNLAGETFVFEAKGDAYHEVSKNKLGSDSYACIAVGGNELFMRVGKESGRDRQEQLVCIRSK